MSWQSTATITTIPKITIIKVSFDDGGCLGNENDATATTITISASVACVTIIQKLNEIY